MQVKKSYAGEAPHDLEELLRDIYGCKKAYASRPYKAGFHADGTPQYNTLTSAGFRAYDRLLATIYALENIGALPNADDVIETLDDIMSENGAYNV